MKILSIVGARPNFMKVAPLHRAFEKQAAIESKIVHTGQHYDAKMSEVFFNQLELPEPHYYLGIGGGSHTQQTARIMLAFEEVMEKEQPDLVLVVGDVNSTIACALVASKMKVPIAHVEAGLRSGDRSMPEEINRILTDSISDYLFVTEMAGMINLAKEGIPDPKIHFVGNVMIDSLVHYRAKAAQLDVAHILAGNEAAFKVKAQAAPGAVVHSEIATTEPTKANGLLTNINGESPIRNSEPQKNSYILITMHRPSNVDSEEGLRSILQIIQNTVPYKPVVFAIHPRTENNLKKFGLYEALLQTPDVILLPPQGYLEFLQLMDNAALIITDSGGIQEETTYLQVPCLTFRDTTERPVTVELGTNQLLQDLNPGTVHEKLLEILEGKAKKGIVPPLWDGKAAERIAEILVGRNL